MIGDPLPHVISCHAGGQKLASPLLAVFVPTSTISQLRLLRSITFNHTQTNMAPHAEEATASNGNTVPVNEGQAPLEPGVKKSIAQGKMMEFPRSVALVLYHSSDFD